MGGVPVFHERMFYVQEDAFDRFKRPYSNHYTLFMTTVRNRFQEIAGESLAKEHPDLAAFEEKQVQHILDEENDVDEDEDTIDVITKENVLLVYRLDFGKGSIDDIALFHPNHEAIRKSRVAPKRRLTEAPTCNSLLYEATETAAELMAREVRKEGVIFLTYDKTREHAWSEYYECEWPQEIAFLQQSQLFNERRNFVRTAADYAPKDLAHYVRERYLVPLAVARIDHREQDVRKIQDASLDFVANTPYESATLDALIHVDTFAANDSTLSQLRPLLNTYTRLFEAVGLHHQGKINRNKQRVLRILGRTQPVAKEQEKKVRLVD